MIHFVDAILQKFNLWKDIEFWGSNTDSELIFQLTSCRFCVMFHLGWILTVAVGLFLGFSWSMLVVPFVVSGLVSLTSR